MLILRLAKQPLAIAFQRQVLYTHPSLGKKANKCISQSVKAQIFPHRHFLDRLPRYILTGDPSLHFFYFYFCIRLRELHHQRLINKWTICPSCSPSCLLTFTHALQRKNTERERERQGDVLWYNIPSIRTDCDMNSFAESRPTNAVAVFLRASNRIRFSQCHSEPCWCQQTA